MSITDPEMATREHEKDSLLREEREDEGVSSGAVGGVRPPQWTARARYLSRRAVVWAGNRLSQRSIFVLLAGTTAFIIAIVALTRPTPQPPYPWRDQCRASFPTHYVVAPAPPLDGFVHPQHVEPLTPLHPAWPYDTPHVPRPDAYRDHDPVGVFVGIFTVASAARRRSAIRETYAHPSRTAGSGMRVMFILGRLGDVSAELQQEVLLEQAIYGDIAFMPIQENMNDGKTFEYFAWAAEHASVPCVSACNGTTAPDYIMKADDDSFIMLDELEHRLRVLPRTLTYWGLLMFGEYHQVANVGDYMTGGGYVLSVDLVRHIAADPFAQTHVRGDEDQRVGDWVRAHPRAAEVVWVTERCWFYDHPRAKGYALSHGYLFPDVVVHLRNATEREAGHVPPYLPGGVDGDAARSWSTVSQWDKTYVPIGGTAAQESEAMIEGSEMSMLHAHNLLYMSLPEGHEGRRVEVDVAREMARMWEARPTREERMRQRGETGSTVVVHAVKREDMWAETALALLE